MSSNNDDNTERVNLKSQLVLALIPSFISQIIAFYRIRKLFYGIVIEIVIFFIDLIIQLAISWPVGMMITLPVTVGVPVYYVRKWTLEFNRANKGLFG
ncbi:MAG: hypothetical protein ACRDFB_09625 [Rhabdochlamydiaceae bacterium]